MIPFARLAAWWKHVTRDRPAILNAAHNHEEASIRGPLHDEAKRLYPHDPVARADWITARCFPESERIVPDRRLDLYGPPWGGPWPADLCAYPPCDPEDGWTCTSHKPAPAGKHHRRQSQGEQVIIASVTDLSEKRRVR